MEKKKYYLVGGEGGLGGGEKMKDIEGWYRSVWKRRRIIGWADGGKEEGSRRGKEKGIY